MEVSSYGEAQGSSYKGGKNMSLKLDLTKGTVKQDIAELPQKMLDYAFEVLMDRARLMQGIAQVLVRVDTGSLRDSIRIERVAPSHHLNMNN